MTRGAEEGHGSAGEGVFRGEQDVEEPLAKMGESEQEGSEVPVASGRLRRKVLEPWEEQSKASSPGKVASALFRCWQVSFLGHDYSTAARCSESATACTGGSPNWAQDEAVQPVYRGHRGQHCEVSGRYIEPCNGDSMGGVLTPPGVGRRKGPKSNLISPGRPGCPKSRQGP